MDVANRSRWLFCRRGKQITVVNCRRGKQITVVALSTWQANTNVQLVERGALDNSKMSWICCNCGLSNIGSYPFSLHSTLLSNGLNIVSFIGNEDDLSSPTATKSPNHVSVPLSVGQITVRNGLANQIREAYQELLTCKEMEVNHQCDRNKVTGLAIYLNSNNANVHIDTDPRVSERIYLPSNYSVHCEYRHSSKHTSNYGETLLSCIYLTMP